MKLNLTPVNMTTAQARVYLRWRFGDRDVLDVVGKPLAQEILKKLESEYLTERKAGEPDMYCPTPIQNNAIAYLEGIVGVPPSWLKA